jgi:hypothetical protein
MTAHERGAAGGPHERGEHLYRRCLAGSVGAYEPVDVAFVDGNVQVFNGGDILEYFGQIFRLNHKDFSGSLTCQVFVSQYSMTMGIFLKKLLEALKE